MLIRTLTLAGAACTLLASAASAQALGNYSGTQANGAGISMTVTTDSATGKPEITSFGVSITANCKPSGSINTGWGIGPNVDFSSTGTAKFVFGNGYPYLYLNVALSVDANNNVTGTITEATPSFASYTTKPSRAIFCSVPKQSFTMSYTGAAAARIAPHVTFGQ